MKLYRLLLVLVLALACGKAWTQTADRQAVDSVSQSDASAPEEAAITYFVVDVSGSVSRFGSDNDDPLQLVKSILAEEFNSLPDESWKSVTFFGRNPESYELYEGCDEPIILGPDLRPEVGVPAFPRQGSHKQSTAIGKALEVVLRNAKRNSSIVLISDGQEECGSDFVAIRKEFPNASIRVIELPLGASSPLQLLEIQPKINNSNATLYDSLYAFDSLINFSNTRVTSETEADRSWSGADWIEKYLWILSYLLMASSAIMFGHRYNKITAAIEVKIEEWREYLRRQAMPNTVDETPAPDDLKLASIESQFDHWKAKSLGLLLIAVPIAIVLALFDGIAQLWNQSALAFFNVIAILLLLHEWVWGSRRSKNSKNKVKKLQLPQSVSWRMTLIIGLGAIVYVGWNLIDFDDARAAAWFSLRSNFSTALALIASGPFLFLGARWIESTRAYATYVNIESQSLSADARQIREAARKAKAERERVELKFRLLALSRTDWYPFAKFSFRPVNSTRRDIEEKVKQLVFSAIRDKSDQDATRVVNGFIEAKSAGGSSFFREAKSIDDLSDSLIDALEELAEAIEKADQQRVHNAIGTLNTQLDEHRTQKVRDLE